MTVEKPPSRPIVTAVHATARNLPAHLSPSNRGRLPPRPSPSKRCPAPRGQRTGLPRAAGSTRNAAKPTCFLDYIRL